MRSSVCVVPVSICVVVSLLAVASAGAQPVLYVDALAPTGGDGAAWGTAFTDLQDGLDAARAAGGSVSEIRVAGGTYRPDRDTGSRSAAFELVDGVLVVGGYAGAANPGDPDERDVLLHETTLSGDLAENDGPDFAFTLENSFHVLRATDNDASAVLDGFTIRGGNASSFGGNDSSGGGLFVWGGGPRFVACRFVANQAFSGGGIFCREASPQLVDCTLEGNAAMTFAGGMYNHTECNPVLVRCVFSGNDAPMQGGGLVNADNCDATVVNCRFVGNSTASYGGGGVLNNNSQAEFINCVFSGNSASNSGYGGGGLRNESSDPRLVNCTFYGNSAGVGGGICNFGDSAPELVNCLLWGNTDNSGNGEAAQIASDTGVPSLDFCCVQGWSGTLGGSGNIGDEPYLVNPAGPDGVLGTPDDLPRLDNCGSPCKDAGDTAALPADVLDLDEDGDVAETIPFDVISGPRVHEGVVDIGAYETTDSTALLADANCDGLLNAFDIDPFVVALTQPGVWRATYGGECDLLCIADINGDGLLDAFDIDPFAAELSGR